MIGLPYKNPFILNMDGGGIALDFLRICKN